MKGKSKQTFVDIMSSTRTSFSGYTPLYLPNGTTLTNVVTTGRVRSAEDIWLEVYNSANIELFSTNETQNAHSGHIHIETDDAAGGFQAGGIEIKMGDNLGPEDAGGKRIRLEAGDGSGGGAGADIVLECGASTGTGNGGGVIVEAGNAGSAEANTSHRILVVPRQSNSTMARPYSTRSTLSFVNTGMIKSVTGLAKTTFIR